MPETARFELEPDLEPGLQQPRHAGDQPAAHVGDVELVREVLGRHEQVAVASLQACDRSLFVTSKNLTDKLYIADMSRGLSPGMPRLLQGGLQIRF